MSTEPQFEDGSALHAINGDVQTHALVSIAFSLKRIADAVNYIPAGNSNLFDMVRTISEKNSGW
jgi:hypothetical protein